MKFKIKPNEFIKQIREKKAFSTTYLLCQHGHSGLNRCNVHHFSGQHTFLNDHTTALHYNTFSKYNPHFFVSKESSIVWNYFLFSITVSNNLCCSDTAGNGKAVFDLLGACKNEIQI